MAGKAQDPLALAGLVGAWYAASVVCTNTSKQLGNQLPSPLVLTLSQLCVSTFLATFLQVLTNSRRPTFHSASHFGLLAALGLVFALGFATLNTALDLMHVSLAMTLRATEPVFALVLAVGVLGDRVSWSGVAALCLVVGGVCVSSFESADATLGGVVVVAVSNVMFALRGVLTKVVKGRYPDTTNTELFHQVVSLATAVQTVLVIASSATVTVTPTPPFVSLSLPSTSSLSPDERTALLWQLMVNGTSFFLYLQLSWVVLDRVSVTTHSLLNSMRRPAVILVSVLQFGNLVTPLNAVGIALACLGSVLYCYARQATPRPQQEQQEQQQAKAKADKKKD